MLFRSNDTATTEIYTHSDTLSLHDALPISVAGNVPAMRNATPPRKLLERIYVEGADTARGIPSEGVPPLLRQAIPVHEAVAVDLHLPGCPPPAKTIAWVLGELCDGRMPDVKSKVKFG